MNFNRRAILQSSTAVALISTMSIAGCSRKTLPSEPVKTVVKSAQQAEASEAVERLLTQATDQILTAYPESASSFGIDHDDYAHLKSKLTDRSYSGQKQIENDVRGMLAQLNKIETSTLSDEQALNVEVVRTVYDRTAEGFDFPFGDVALLNSNWSYRNSPYTVAQNTGAFVEIPSFLDGSHSIKKTQDAEDYLLRLESYAGQLEGETERVRMEGERDVVLPDFLLEKTLDQLRGARDKASTDWGLVTSVKTRTSDMGADFTNRAKAIADERIRPAIERQIEALEVVRSKASDHAGVWAIPGGDEYYAWALKASTTTTMTPDEVHQMGLDELASLQSRMDPILRSIGYTSGSVGERMSALGNDPRYHFAQGDEGRAEIMAFIEDRLSDIRGRMPQAFETLVPGFLEVTRIAPEVEAGAPGAYGGPGSIDGTKPGHYWINLRTTKLHNKFSLPDLTYHEAIPGHVWQGEYTFKQPLIRSLLAFNAYSEGWALYAEQIADELGVYDAEPVGRLGYLQSLAFRACRLVVDTGLHAKRWTREEANNWFVTNNGSNPEEVRGEVDRYCAWPGQACGYKVGHTAIVNLREKAKSALGDQFDFRRFNDSVVLGGSVPMTVLERVIDDHITREG